MRLFNFPVTRDHILVVVLTVTAFFIRLQGVTETSLWNDEFWTVFITSKIGTFWEMLKFLSDKYAENPPFFMIFMRLWVSLFGDSEFVIRLPSVITGTLSIPALYFVSKKIYSAKIGFLAAFLLMLLPVHIHYSQEARNYAFFLFLSLLSTYFLLNITVQRRNKYYWGYILSSVLLLYTHFYALFFLLGHSIFLLKNDKRTGEVLTMYSILLILFIPWIIPTFHVSTALAYGTWIQKESFINGFIAQIRFFSPSSNSIPTYFIFLGSFIIGLCIAVSHSLKNKKYAFLIESLYLLPVLLPLTLSQFFQPFFVPRFAFISLTSFVLFVSLGLEYVLKKTLVIIMFVGILLVAVPLNRNDYIPFEDWRGAVEYLENMKAPVFVYPETQATMTGVEYYSHELQVYSASFLEKLVDDTCISSFYVISRYPVASLPVNCAYDSDVVVSKGSLSLFKYTLVRLNPSE